MSDKTILETDRFVIYERNGKRVGYEKPARTLKDDDRVFVGSLGGDVAKDTADALEKSGAGAILKRFKRVGVKINLGGGIQHVPSTFTDPFVLKGIALFARDHGVEPFACEADMRGFVIDEALMKRRGETWDVMQASKIPFVNLSNDGVPFNCVGVERRVPYPMTLLDPETAIVSAAVPKDHWECGLSFTQKNMYGAISERRKALYHRVWSRIDKVVAATARILRPDIAVLGGRWAGAGLGPHFCAGIPLNRVVVGADAIRVDAYMAKAFGYPYEKIEYARINAAGEEATWRLIDGSSDIPPETVAAIRRRAITPGRRLFWKTALYPQYFIPHMMQHGSAPKLEPFAASLNRLIFPDK